MFYTVVHIAVIDILMDKSFHLCCIIFLDRSGIAGVKGSVFLRLVIHMVKLPSGEVTEIVDSWMLCKLLTAWISMVFVNVLTTGTPSFNTSYYLWLIIIVIKQWSRWKWFPENPLQSWHNCQARGEDLVLLKFCHIENTSCLYCSKLVSTNSSEYKFTR